MIVAKSSGAARLDLEQAERRYFAIPILTFYEFIIFSAPVIRLPRRFRFPD
jgi:hypothetical protein